MCHGGKLRTRNRNQVQFFCAFSNSVKLYRNDFKFGNYDLKYKRIINGILYWYAMRINLFLVSN